MICKGITLKGIQCKKKGRYEGYCTQHKEQWYNEDNQIEIQERKQEIVNLDTCSICLNNIQRGENIFITKCNHKYHLDCFNEYLHNGNNNNKCCMCRTNLNIKKFNHNNRVQLRNTRIELLERSVVIRDRLIESYRERTENLERTVKELESKNKLQERIIKIHEESEKTIEKEMETIKEKEPTIYNRLMNMFG